MGKGSHRREREATEGEGKLYKGRGEADKEKGKGKGEGKMGKQIIHYFPVMLEILGQNIERKIVCPSAVYIVLFPFSIALNP